MGPLPAAWPPGSSEPFIRSTGTPRLIAPSTRDAVGGAVASFSGALSIRRRRHVSHRQATVTEAYPLLYGGARPSPTTPCPPVRPQRGRLPPFWYSERRGLCHECTPAHQRCHPASCTPESPKDPILASAARFKRLSLIQLLLAGEEV